MNYKKFLPVLLIAFLFMFVSCEKDGGLLPMIAFKTGAGYQSADAGLAVGSAIKIGIDASKSEKRDVLKRLNVSKGINGAALTTVENIDLKGDDGDVYAYDFNDTVAGPVGTVTTYTFTVTNRDGLVNQVSLKITAN